LRILPTNCGGLQNIIIEKVFFDVYLKKN